MIRRVSVARQKNPFLPPAASDKPSNSAPSAEAELEEVLKLQRVKQAVELAATGKLTYREIGALLNPPLPAPAVKRMVTAALKEHIADKVETIRERHQQVLDEIKDDMLTKSRKGNLNATDKLLAALKAERDLNGLNAPIEVAHVNLVNALLDVVKEIVTPTQFTQIVARLAEIDSRSEIGRDQAGGDKPAPLGYTH